MSETEVCPKTGEEKTQLWYVCVCVLLVALLSEAHLQDAFFWKISLLQRLLLDLERSRSGMGLGIFLQEVLHGNLVPLSGT